MSKRDDIIINHIIDSLSKFAFNDIKKIIEADKRTVLASFILCSCFIEQVSGFRYGKVAHKTGKQMFEDFVSEYMPSVYVPKQLREDLRNKLVHNYSLGDTYSLVEKMPDLHLKVLGNRTLINIENFVSELEEAFNKYVKHLNEDSTGTLKANALKWYEEYKILGMAHHDFFSYEEAENIVKLKKEKIKGFSETQSWPYFLICLLITPSGSEIEKMAEIIKYRYENKCDNKEALISLSLFVDAKFDVYIFGSTTPEPTPKTQVSFIKLSDYESWTGKAL